MSAKKGKTDLPQPPDPVAEPTFEQQREAESRLLAARRAKVAEVRAKGVNPYPSGFVRADTAEAVRREMEGKTPEQVE